MRLTLPWSLLLIPCFGTSALGVLPGAFAGQEMRGQALIQTRGPALRPGAIQGGSQVLLERADGGDTPVLSFLSSAGPVRLLLDTGASATMVTPALVRRLGLSQRALAPEEFSLAGGGAACPSLTLFSTLLPALHLPGTQGQMGFRLVGAEALVISGAALPPGVDGVLGAPVLRQAPVLVDPLRQIVALGPPALQWAQAQRFSSQVVPLTWRRGVPLLPLRILPASGEPATTLAALADTGAEGVFLTPALAARLTSLGSGESARLVGVCGLQEVRRQHVFGLGIGADRPPNRSAQALILTNPVFQLLQVQAIVGQELLRERRQLWRLDLLPPRLELW